MSDRRNDNEQTQEWTTEAIERAADALDRPDDEVAPIMPPAALLAAATDEQPTPAPKRRTIRATDVQLKIDGQPFGYAAEATINLAEPGPDGTVFSPEAIEQIKEQLGNMGRMPILGRSPLAGFVKFEQDPNHKPRRLPWANLHPSVEQSLHRRYGPIYEIPDELFNEPIGDPGDEQIDATAPRIAPIPRSRYLDTELADFLGAEIMTSLGVPPDVIVGRDSSGVPFQLVNIGTTQDDTEQGNAEQPSNEGSSEGSGDEASTQLWPDLWTVEDMQRVRRTLDYGDLLPFEPELGE